MPRILVVDDNPDNRDMLSRRLVRHGYDAPVAADGQSALDFLAAEDADLVLLDVMMPEIDGNEVLARLRTSRSAGQLPVIMVTAKDAREDIVQSLHLGANDYVTKPIDLPVLLARIDRQLALRDEVRSKAAEPANEQPWPDVERLLAEGESERFELKSTLRWNLKANRAGKEIELSWLKTIVAFMNTDGGVLVVGVEDDGNVLGIGPDGFDNADRYLLHANNLIRQHIGLEHVANIRLGLRPVAGHEVLVVVCQASAQPAFLKEGKDEAFYVRVGPGSRPLNTRETLKYLDDRERLRGGEDSKGDG